MDGCTKGPYSYSGAIGLLLKDCEKTPVLKFDQIDCTLQPFDLKDIKKLKPPLTMYIKYKDLREICKEEEFPVQTFEEFPCHTQSVERCVKLISEAAMNVCGETARDGYISAKLQERKELPTIDNKGQYYSNT
ncbi:hypothetical protein AVEN_27249-1 [Araneus ventricosus]|uniref:Uncharacterized protein n=1 Tax=Araneus ventricosus TaxID=182803 RepID=A0A4Y2C9P9_ARAVE|nr:hypothetical protein AVEN_27249-1 [Araneus ventricosus]